MLRLALAALLVHGVSQAAAEFPTDWKPARATHYSAPGDTWTIHDGSCTHKYIWPDIGPGAVRREVPAWGAVRVLPCAGCQCNMLKASTCQQAPNYQPPPCLLPQPPAGWDAGALSDQNEDFIGSCGWGWLRGTCCTACHSPYCPLRNMTQPLPAPAAPPSHNMHRRCYEVRCDPCKFTDGGLIQSVWGWGESGGG